MMMMQQQQQSNTRRAGQLAEAFGFSANNSLKQPAPLPQQQEQVNATNAVITVAPLVSQKKSEAAEFLEKHNVPTFVPVYASTQDIEPRFNESARGQVSWRCAFCGANSFGHHCMSCVRHRDQAALRVFVGQLSKEGCVPVVEKLVEVLCPHLSAPPLMVEQHTDAKTGRGKGCAWLYVNTIQDIAYVVKCLNKRTFLTVEENSGNVGFVAFPASFTNQEIEEAFQLDHEAQEQHVKDLFMFTVVSAQVPKALQGMIITHSNRINNHNNNVATPFVRNPNFYNNQQQQQQLPPPPSYSSSLPLPPAFVSPAVPKSFLQQQQQNFGYQQQQQQAIVIPDISCSPSAVQHQQQGNFLQNNRHVEEQQQQPTAFLGQHYQQQQPQYACRCPSQQQYAASWNAAPSVGAEDNNFGYY